MLKTFSNEVKEAIFDAQNGFCFCTTCCFEKIESVHHKLSNTVANNKKYPLFINSIFNAIGVSNFCHAEKSHLETMKVTEQQAQVYEDWLENFKTGVKSE